MALTNAGCATTRPGPRESAYRDFFAARVNGATEVRTEDGGKADIVDDQYAWEVDFEGNWAEAAGQALFYAEKLGKRPGVVLVARGPRHDRAKVERLLVLARKYGIKVVLVATENENTFSIGEEGPTP